MTIFKRREDKIDQVLVLHRQYRLREVKGSVGLELECEGNKFPKGESELPSLWTYHKDNSLRGIDNAEYVLRKPLPFDVIPDAVDVLFDTLSKYGTKLDISNRTSLHVHLNFQQAFPHNVATFAALFITVEELLSEYCGPHRAGNLFCLRAKDSPVITSFLGKYLNSNFKSGISKNYHYSGMNLHALTKFGSIEIRTMRGCTKKEEVLEWVGILQHLYELAFKMKDPRSVCELFSREGPHGFLQNVLGEYAQKVISESGFTFDEVSESLYEGIRMAQDVCYCRDWDLYSPLEMKPDPFKRAEKASMHTLQSLVEMPPQAVNYIAGQQWATLDVPVPVPSPDNIIDEWFDPEPDFEPEEDYDD